MGWGRIDDGFDDHAKVIALLEHEDGAAAIGLWTLCFTWAHRNTRKKGKIPGLVPSSLPRRYIGPKGRDLAALLVKVGLWDEHPDDGWMFHDFERYLPTEQTRDARSEAGKRGAKARWGNRAGRDGNLLSGDGNGMRTDGRPDGPDAGREASANGSHGKQPADGNEPSSDSNLPSGLPSGDSNGIANDGSRTPARRAISNEIAPTPAPVVPAAPAAADTAQTLIAEWLDHCRKRPPDRVIGQIAKELTALLGEGHDTADIRAGLARWHQAGKHPSTLASFVNEVMNATPGNGAAPRPSTTDQRVADAQAVKAKLRNRHQEQA